MRTLVYLALLCAATALLSCNKCDERAARLSGVWECTETRIRLYENNEQTKDSTVNQNGKLVLQTGGPENDCSTDLPYAPCIPFCHWEIPQKKTDQIFFFFSDENSQNIYSNSVMIEKRSHNKLVLVKCYFDGHLTLNQKDCWTFRKVRG